MRHVRKRQRNRQHLGIIGFDSETLQGPPITFQFHSNEFKKITGCVFIGERSPTLVFLRQLEKLPPGHYRMYGHNLEFDMLSALWDARVKIRDGNINLRIGAWTIEGRYSKPVFANFTDGKRHIELVDSFLWFMTSLEKAAELVCPDVPKLLRPPGLGEKNFSPKDEDFRAYAMRDAVIAYYLGLAIEKFHAELEIPSQISLASMAAAVFRLKYMQADIYQPPLYEWMVGAAASYHGGVNRIRPDAKETWHMNVTALDISSAYPDAWDDLPDFADPNRYKAFRTKSISNLKSVPRYGVYKISGHTMTCDWPALFNHDFKPLQGRFEDVWVCSYELNEALSTGEVRLKSISGYYYDWDGGYSPFSAYAQDFYRSKTEAKDAVMRFMHKITLNAPTGKLIQTSPDYTLVDGQLVKIRRAGGLYHPFAASLTTGHTRAAIHALEHKHEALHTATDGIFVPGNIRGAKQKTLGAVVAEGHGDLALFRNKLYIFYTNDKGEGAYESQAFKGRYILKCARHGFQGTVGDLERMLLTPDRSYKTNKPIKLKTAIRTKDTPNKFVVKERKLRNIGENFKVIEH